MTRERMLASIKKQGNTPWDIIVIGGGATGLGTALDAASRGYRTLLLEQSDFSKGTSSRSTKLVHGGVLVNYMQVTGLIKNSDGLIAGVEAMDQESGESFQLQAKSVVNATGVLLRLGC